MAEKTTHYYVPEKSPWPFITAVALFLVAFGAANFIQQNSGSGIVNNEGSSGSYILSLGIIAIIVMMYVWFRDTIKESLANMNSEQMDRSYRMGMLWLALIISLMMASKLVIGCHHMVVSCSPAMPLSRRRTKTDERQIF